MTEATVGLLHPGEMGAAVGQCLAANGHRVLWVPQGRGPASAARAAAAGLTAAVGEGLAELVREADVIVSVCPPHAALEVAYAVAGFGGLYVDANAVSPDTAREIARIVEAGGASYVDGGIIGTPPVAPGFIRLYLSGARAGEVERLFAGGPVDARVIGGLAAGSGAGPFAGPFTGPFTGPGAGSTAGPFTGPAAGPDAGLTAASAVKMAYASWTKGSAALLLAARALARAEGVEDALLAEWDLSQPGLAGRSARAAGSAAAKGWRWVAEMEEIATAMAAAGLPDGFHQAAAEVYRRAQGDSLGPAFPASGGGAVADALEAILSALLSPR